MGRKGTNELISGEKPFIAILSNLKCLFTRLIVLIYVVEHNDICAMSFVYSTFWTELLCVLNTVLKSPKFKPHFHLFSSQPYR